MAKEQAPAFQFYPKDFLSEPNVVVMTAEQVGGYWLLVSMCWLEGSLPDDARALAKLARIPYKRWEHQSQLIMCCFSKNHEGRLVHGRLERIRGEQAQYRERRANAGRRGGEAKASNATNPASNATNLASNATPLLQHSPSKALANPSSSSATSSSTSSTERRAPFGYVFRGKRLDVSDRMHEIVMKAVGNRAEAADWFALYAEWDDAAVKADDGVFNPLNWLKAKAEAHFKARPAMPQFCRHRHVPPCANDAACTSRYLREQEGVA